MIDSHPSIPLDTPSNSWDHVQAEIDRSKIPRINYKKILGESLTSKAYRYYKQGRHWEECFVDVIQELSNFGLSDYETYRKVKIRITSAYSEMNISKNVKA